MLHQQNRSDKAISVRPQFAADQPIPRYKLAADELPAETAYEVVHDELLLDGQARLNLATFAFRLRDGVDFNVFQVSRPPAPVRLARPRIHVPARSGGCRRAALVVRNGFGHELAAKLVEHLRDTVSALSTGRPNEAQAFHH